MPVSLTKVYTDLLKQATKVGLGRSEHADNAPSRAACPRNMICKDRWTLVIPRRRAAINKQAGVNAIDMLGLIAASTRNEINNRV
ncbi:hypothetical protein BDV29DRAFT_172086 [Aspergillus leporis]|uniref:ATP adenylyltransferase C-terminal domain-containing protein n=1 Tax=Aspergillus leporis TaxID=41062 RepID=A0A5N5X7U5_9EURO|nr:hypothetical protein BDV29DRAFT_172086 [Aspergillus leporis]